MKNSIILLFLLISSFGFAQDESLEVPKITVKIHLNETVQFNELSVKFSSVIGDSRCPIDVQCIWAGEAKIVVEIKEKGNKDVELKELLFNGKQTNIIYTSEKYNLVAERLDPYPTVSNSGNMKYVLLVSEENK